LTPREKKMGRHYAFRTTFASGAINTDARTISGVSVITEGPALGHGVMIDAESLSTVKTCAETYGSGLKVKMNHRSGADAIVGRLSSFRIEGQQLRADLQLLKSHPQTAVVLEMAETMPESFGLSISFSGALEGEEGETQFMRCLEIYSCDIVDSPAANPSGLFSKFDTTNNQHTKPMLIETPEYLALVAEHKTTCELGVKLKTDFEAVTAEKTELSAKLSEAQNKLTDADKAITELKASIEKTAAEHAAALSDFDKKVSAKAATHRARPVLSSQQGRNRRHVLQVIITHKPTCLTLISISPASRMPRWRASSKSFCRSMSSRAPTRPM